MYNTNLTAVEISQSAELLLSWAVSSMLSAFDSRRDNSTAKNQIEVHTSNLTSSLRGLSQGDKKLSVEFAFEENISLRISYEIGHSRIF